MDPLSILIKIAAVAPGVEGVFNATARGAQNLGADVNKSGQAMRGMASLTKQAREQAEELQARMRATGETFSEATKSLNLNGDAAKKAAQSYRVLIQTQREEAEEARETARVQQQAAKDTHDSFERVRNAGVAITAVGAGGLMLSARLRQVSEEGRAVEARLEGILSAQKRLNDLDNINGSIGDLTEKAHLPDDDPVREAAVQMTSDQVATKDINPLLEATIRNANATGQSIEQVGTAFAKAYAEGSLTRLKRMNILFTQQEQDAVSAAFAISEVAGRAEFMRVVMDSTARSTAELGAGLTETQKAANDAARSIDDFQTNAGEGAASAQASVERFKGSLAGVANSAPGIERTAGAFGYVGSAALSGIGSITTFIGQVGMARLGLQTMGLTGVASFGSIGTAIGGVTAAIGTGIAAIGAFLAAIAVPLAIGAAVVGVGYAAHHAYWRYFGEGKGLHDNIDRGNNLDPNKVGPTGKSRLSAFNATRNATGKRAATEEEFRAFYTDEDTRSDAQKALVAKMEADDAAAKAAKKGNDAMKAQTQQVMANASQGVTASPTVLAGGGYAPPAPSSSSDFDSGAADDIEALQDEQARGRKGYDPNSASERLRLARRAQSHERQHEAQQRALQRQAKAQQREAERTQQAYTRDADAQRDVLADVQLAQLEADTELRVKQLEEDGASARDIAQVKADALMREARVRATGLRSTDKYGADKLLKLAQIKANHTLDMAQFEKEGGVGKRSNTLSESAALARLRAGLAIGSGVFGEPSSSGGGPFNPYGHDAAFGDFNAPFVTHAAAMEAPEPMHYNSSQRIPRVRSRTSYNSQSEMARIDFEPVEFRIPRSNYEEDLKGLPNL